MHSNNPVYEYSNIEMKGAVKVLTAFNIPVFIHWSFALIIGYIIYIGIDDGFQNSEIAWSVLTVLGLFFCVTLHEFGHALAARKYGIGTQDIILYPIGGVARLTSIPSKPVQELVVAIAGPLVNFAIVLLLLPYIYFSDDIDFPYTGLALVGTQFLPAIFIQNLILGLFNLIPAFPMDGGRIFRALLKFKLSNVKATLIAARVGQVIAIAALIYSILGGLGPFTALICIFIFSTAQQEYRHVKTQSKLTEATVSDIMRFSFTSFFPDEPMYSAIDELEKGEERSFIVFNREEKIIGILEERNIIRAAKEKRRTAEVIEYINQNVVTVTPKTTLEQLYGVFASGISIVPVMNGEELVGIVDVSQMNNYLR